ncbi:MAG: hypothetical protein RJA98_669, partial [Pseudomonadota bacterium]
VNGDITIAASSRIDLIGGDSKVSLNGGNIDFITPGSFTVKAAAHNWGGGGGGGAELPVLPTGLQQAKNWIEVNHRDPDSVPMVGQKYKIFFEGGAVVSGALDANGFARHDNIPNKALRVEYEPRIPIKESPADPLSNLLNAVQEKLA